jgi:hypothetical protein
MTVELKGTHSARGYFLFTLKGVENLDHSILTWAKGEKIEVASYSASSPVVLTLRKMKGFSRSGSRLLPQANGDYFTSIKIPKTFRLPRFSAITLLGYEANTVRDELTLLLIDFLSDLPKLPHRKSPHKAPFSEKPFNHLPHLLVPSDISLRQAVEAVNYHKSLISNDLALSIDSNGNLRALIEY